MKNNHYHNFITFRDQLHYIPPASVWVVISK